MKKIILLILTLFIISCAPKKIYITRTQKIYRYPKKTNEITKPDVHDLDPDLDYNSEENIERRLKNLSAIKAYVNQLKKKIKKYENDIDIIMIEEESNNE